MYRKYLSIINNNYSDIFLHNEKVFMLFITILILSKLLFALNFAFVKDKKDLMYNEKITTKRFKKFRQILIIIILILYTLIYFLINLHFYKSIEIYFFDFYVYLIYNTVILLTGYIIGFYAFYKIQNSYFLSILSIY